MHIAFFGSPHIAATILEAIRGRFPISLVVTQPDKKVGRKQEWTPTPVKQFAIVHKIPVVDNLSIFRNIDKSKAERIDLALVVAYGELIPKKILEIPRYGFINVHYSLLPQYRGASPVQWAILNGDTETGVTIIQMDEELDHGHIIAQKKVVIEEIDTAGSLMEKLTNHAIPLLLETLNSYHETANLPNRRSKSASQRLVVLWTKQQVHNIATYTRRLMKDDGFVEFQTLKKAMNNEQLEFSDLPNLQKEILRSGLRFTVDDLRITIHNFIRAMLPWPIAWTILPNGKRVKIYSSKIKKRSGDIYGALIIDEIQLEGKQKTRDTSFIRILNQYTIII